MIVRRQFIAGLGAAAAWPLAVWGQQPGKMPTIGVLGVDARVWSPWTAAFVDRLRALGWVDGRTIAIEYRWDEGNPERSSEIAAEFVRRNVDVIVANGAGVPAVKLATSVIPVVFPLGNDPVAGGLVASLAHPGGNVTGLSIQGPDLAGKRVELLRQVVPHLRRLAILFDGGYPSAAQEMNDVQAATRALGIEAVPLEIRRVEDIAPVFEANKTRADALYAVGAALVTAYRTRIVILALGARLPTIFNTREYLEAGGLMSYGPNFLDQFRRAADLVDKILHGTKPGDIPVEQPTKFELVINLTTAQALELNIPPSVLAIADEVIE